MQNQDVDRKVSDGISVFHEIYMPNRAALEFAIRQIRSLDPPVKIIAPQHGFPLKGDLMHNVMDRLCQLPVGMDRVVVELDSNYLRGYAEVYREMVALAQSYLGKDDADKRLRGLPDDHPLASYTRRIKVEIKTTPKAAAAQGREKVCKT